MGNRYVRHLERNGLSPRELQLLQVLCEGLCLKEAAQRMGISERTVSCQKTALMRTAGVLTDVQLGIWAHANAYVTQAPAKHPPKKKICSRCRSADRDDNSCYCKGCKKIVQNEWRRRTGRRPYGVPGNPAFKTQKAGLSSDSCNCGDASCSGLTCDSTRATVVTNIAGRISCC
jgi:DNA-binding CsgD family transcriptional regulator